jgi:hypothetical protein
MLSDGSADPIAALRDLQDQTMRVFFGVFGDLPPGERPQIHVTFNPQAQGVVMPGFTSGPVKAIFDQNTASFGFAGNVVSGNFLPELDQPCQIPLSAIEEFKVLKPDGKAVHHFNRVARPQSPSPAPPSPRRGDCHGRDGTVVHVCFRTPSP